MPADSTPRKIDWNRPVELDRDMAAQLGVVGYWPFLERGGTITRDRARSRCDSTLLSGTTRGFDAKVGPFLDFASASSQYASMADSSVLDITSGWWSLWVKKKGNGAFERIFSKVSSNGDHTVWGAQFVSDNTVQFYATVDNDAGVRYVQTVATITDTQWHHLLFSYAAATSTAKIYIDGIERATGQPGSGGAGSGTLFSGALTNSSGSLDLARLRFTGSSYFGNLAIAGFAMGNRPPAANEPGYLYANPYALLWQPSQRRIFFFRQTKTVQAKAKKTRRLARVA